MRNTTKQSAVTSSDQVAFLKARIKELEKERDSFIEVAIESHRLVEEMSNELSKSREQTLKYQEKHIQLLDERKNWITKSIRLNQEIHDLFFLSMLSEN